MNHYLISMFIDDELGLDDKIYFVETVCEKKSFKEETVDLLHQEKLIRSEIVDHIPPVRFREKRKFSFPILRPFSLFASGLAAAIIILFLFSPSQEIETMLHRFVIYRPDVNRADITGSFTGWAAIPMKKVGSSGYWEINLDLPEGEHRFSYILEGKHQIADPTIMTREKDDFGGENSILDVNMQT